MNHPTKEHLELAQANVTIALQHADQDLSVTFLHVERAIKELKDAEYTIWHQTHTSGVPYKVEVRA